MASLSKHPKSQYWTACYTDRTGRQVKRSTKETDKGSALSIALEFERIEKLAKTGNLTTAQIQKVLNDVSEKVIGDTVSIPTVKAYFEQWMKLVKSRNAAGTVERYQNTVDMFLAKLGVRAKQPISSISPRHIEEFLQWRIEESKVAPKTVIVDLKTLNTAFRRAETHQLIPKNPVPLVPLPKMDSSEREAFTEEEMNKIVNSAPSVDWQTIILLSYFAGLRLGDCVSLSWENIDAEQGAIVYAQKKTGKKVTVPIHPTLLKHLEYLTQFGISGFISPALANKGPGGKHGLSESFKRIVSKAGVDLKIVDGKGKRKFCCHTFHSLRHTFNSRLANLGVSPEVRMALAGHSSMEMNKKYTHFDFSTLKNAVHQIHGKKQTK